METSRSSRVWTLLLTGSVVAVALALRLPRLDRRPMHGDEANQAVRTGLLLETGIYHYDPSDHHGPVLYFAALPFCRATAATFAETTEWNYRLVPVLFSCLTLLLMTGLGLKGDSGLFDNRSGLFCALTLTAVSPAMVYYSRFFIQESMLVTFLTGMLVCGRLYVRERVGMRPERVGARPACLYALGFGTFAGLAVATKETVVLSFAAMALAALVAFGPRRLFSAWNTRHVALAAGAAVFVAAVLFSSFFTYPRGVYDAVFATVSAYAKRAMDVPEHQHPWNFYLSLLFWFKYGRGPVWSEAGVLIPGLLAAVAAVWPRQRDAEAAGHARFVRFILVYTLALTALYSAIPYKTPWCVLSFLHGYILLAGIGVGVAVEGLKRFSKLGRAAGGAGVAVLVGLLVWRHAEQACRACFTWPADPRNPYVYAHTGSDAMNLVAEVEAAARRASGYDTLIAIAVPTPDTWPLPWYLRKYKQVGYWTRVADIPAAVMPEIVIAAADQGDLADARFGRGKQASFFGIRPGVLLHVFVPVQESSGKRK
ncbi:MAG: flippase activity-associated protein Agl23 [bacterium]